MIQELANYTSIQPILPLAKVTFLKNPATGEVTMHEVTTLKEKWSYGKHTRTVSIFKHENIWYGFIRKMWVFLAESYPRDRKTQTAEW
jgi:hypothetical protein